MRNIYRIVLLGTLLLWQLVSIAQRQGKPNFIIIFTDDQGYNDLGCYGSPLIRTPNIDRMAAEGVRFTQFYAQPICGPSRTAILTGCYPIRVAEVGNTKRLHPFVHPKEILLARVLKDAGYATGVIGKWDINGHAQSFSRDDVYPTEMGFDYWYGLPSSNDMGGESIYRNKEIVGKNTSHDSLTKRYTREALQFIERNKDRPFFLYLPHSMPHTRLGASENFKGKSRFGPYGDAIEEIDWSTGQIRKKLEELGLDGRTIVVYTSDNGPWYVRGTHGGSAFPLRGEKITTWEGGVRVPCVIWGGGVKKGLVTDELATTMDFFPTFAKLAGARIPEDRIIDGKDISRLLREGKSGHGERVYYYYLYTHLQAVRRGDWKLVLPRPQAPEWFPNLGKRSVFRNEDIDPVRDFELYNLREDPGERRDVAAAHPDVVASLKEVVEEARRDLGDYNRIGAGVRFYDPGDRRPDAAHWAEKEKSGWKQEIKVHPFYDDGSRNL